MQPIRPHGHLRPSDLTTTWPISPAPPRPSQTLPVEHDAAADAGAPEHAEQRAVRLRGAELELRVGGDGDVVGEPDRRAERRPELLGERVGALPVGQVAGARDRAGLVVDHAGRADADRREVARARRSAPSSASRIAPTIASATSAGPPSVGVGMAGGAEHLVVLVHHDRLDLRAAEVDAAVPCHCSPLTRWRADPRRPRFPPNHTDGTGRTAPRRTSAPRGCGGSPRDAPARPYA